MHPGETFFVMCTIRLGNSHSAGVVHFAEPLSKTKRYLHKAISSPYYVLNLTSYLTRFIEGQRLNEQDKKCQLLTNSYPSPYSNTRSWKSQSRAVQLLSDLPNSFASAPSNPSVYVEPWDADYRLTGWAERCMAVCQSCSREGLVRASQAPRGRQPAATAPAGAVEGKQRQIGKGRLPAR